MDAPTLPVGNQHDITSDIFKKKDIQKGKHTK